MKKRMGEIENVLERLVKNQVKGIDSGIPFIVGPPGIG